MMRRLLRLRGRRGRILVVDHITPRPDRDSGSASTYSYLQILSRAGYQVTFMPFDLAPAGRYTEALSALGIETVSSANWASPQEAMQALAPRHDVILLYRAEAGGRLFDLARVAAPQARIVFHPVDLNFLREQREAALTNDSAKLSHANAMRTHELDLIKRADATIVVSTHEHDLLTKLTPSAPVHQIPILRETPSLTAPLESVGRRDIVFIGGFWHAPNADAVTWFLDEVWPLARSRGITDKFVVVGSMIPDSIQDQADESVEVRGWVEDLDPLFASCRATVAPLRFGGGIKGKIVTSLSYGVPVIATSIAAEGMRLQHGVNVLIADEPDQMADQLAALCGDVALWETLSQGSQKAFAEQFSHQAGKDQVLAVFDSLMDSRKSWRVRR